MFKHLQTYFILIALPFVMVLTGAVIFFDAIKLTILRNPHPQINYTIFVIIIAGGLFVLVNARRLLREAQILKLFTHAVRNKTDLATLKDLTSRFRGDIAPLLQMVATSGERAITHQEQRALEHELANSRSRLTRRNALPQYLTGLLVGMGLVGTFIGLLSTLNDISVLISSFADLDVSSANTIQVFAAMIERMKAPMRSMGIAFSASLFGLLGSIILGLMMVGIRRLEGDIFSVLSSEVGRHIELALARGSDKKIAAKEASDYTTDKILLRIEERLAETSRLQQRALAAEVDDFNRQRTEMIRAITEQAEAHNGFRTELHHLGRQLGSIFGFLEKDGGELAARIPAPAGGSTDGGVMPADTFDIARLMTEQIDANNGLRAELQQMAGQLDAITGVMEKGRSEVSEQISELIVHLSADSKQSHILFTNEMQQLGSLLANNTNIIETSNGDLSGQLSELRTIMAGNTQAAQEHGTEMLRTLAEQNEASSDLRDTLQHQSSQLNSQLTTLFDNLVKSNSELAERVEELRMSLSGDAKDSQEQRASMLNTLREQVGERLETLYQTIKKGNSDISTQIIEQMVYMDGDAKESREQRADMILRLTEQVKANNNFRNELLNLANLLEAILRAVRKSGGDVSGQFPSDSAEAH